MAPQMRLRRFSRVHCGSRAAHPDRLWRRRWEQHMKKIVCAAFLSATAIPALAADVGVSISVGQPGFYGQINIGNIPPPPVVYAQPVVITRSPQRVSVEPIYLHVPPGHEKHWSKHCAEY